ncbi:MAG: hypothetical protein OHK0046_47440 [Anaerolineae bacterium]
MPVKLMTPYQLRQSAELPLQMAGFMIQIDLEKRNVAAVLAMPELGVDITECMMMGYDMQERMKTALVGGCTSDLLMNVFWRGDNDDDQPDLMIISYD